MTAIGMLLYGDLGHDSRVQREATALAAAGHRVTLACLPGPDGSVQWAPPHGVAVLPVAAPIGWAAPGSGARGTGHRTGPRRLAWMAAYLLNVIGWGWRARRAIGRDARIWHAHDFTGLLAAWSPRHGLPPALVYDLHELHVEQPGGWSRLPRPARALVEALERRGIRDAAAVVTVNDAVAAELRSRYGARHVRVVHNCAPRRRSRRRSARLRDATGLPVTAPLVLYHGLFAAPRGLRQLLAALREPGMEDVHAAFLGYGELRSELISAAQGREFGGRVHVLDAVPPDQVVEWVASADVVVMPIQPDSLNGRLSTPNKLFEAIVAGVPVVTSDFPAMARIVNEAGIGAVCDPTDPGAIARALLGVLELRPTQAAALRSRCRESAKRWNWEVEARRLLDVYASIDPGEAEPIRDVPPGRAPDGRR